MVLMFLHGKIIFIGLENFKNFEIFFLKSPKDKIRDDPPSKSEKI